MAPRKGRNLSDDRQFSVVVDSLSGGYKTVGQMVYAVLREAILTGAFAPGEWLRQESLAEAIGVSRIPVRTALLKLESEGMITFHPHRGARVRTLTAAQVDEIYGLRTLLETYALRRAMDSLTPQRLADLSAIAKKLDAGHDSGGEFLDLRIAFYRALYDAENNPLLVGMIEDLRSHVGRYYLGIRFDTHEHLHSTVVRHLAKGDLAGAEEWLTKHLDEIRVGIRDLIAEDSAEPAAATTEAAQSAEAAKPAEAAKRAKPAGRPRGKKAMATSARPG
jgi:DNA-binding GntR family transcriptional regulator